MPSRTQIALAFAMSENMEHITAQWLDAAGLRRIGGRRLLRMQRALARRRALGKNPK